MSSTNTIILRPRFKFHVKQDKAMLLQVFEDKKTTQSEFIVSRIDDHVFIKIPKTKQHFWSPQLHLEINKEFDKEGSIIYGLFGPNPTIWTLFMFLHFLVAGFFITFSIWSYVNWSLADSYSLQLFFTLFAVVIWLALYLSGRLGKKAGMNEMHQLHHFMRDTLRSRGIHAVD
jgi:hypothetical protein